MDPYLSKLVVLTNRRSHLKAAMHTLFDYCDVSSSSECRFVQIRIRYNHILSGQHESRISSTYPDFTILRVQKYYNIEGAGEGGGEEKDPKAPLFTKIQKSPVP